MRITIKILFLLCFVNNALCQVDSSEIRQLDSQKTKSEIISKYRGLILDKAVENNKIKAKEIFYDAISKYENDFYLAFYPSEKWIISLWLGDYNYILAETATTDSLSIARLNNQIKPSDDQLYFVLCQILSKQKNEISADISSSTSLSSVDKDFLKLIISTLITPNNTKYQKTINSEATKFISEFPQSRYDAYVRNFIRYEYGPKGFQFGIEYFGGVSLNTGKLSKQFSNSGSFGFGFIFGYEKFHLNTRGLIVFNRLLQDTDYKGITWEKDSRAFSGIFEISVAHDFRISPQMAVQPILGIAWYTTAPIDSDIKQNKDLENVEINSKCGPIFGVDFSLFRKRFNYFNFFYNRPANAFYSFNIRYLFQPVTFKKEYDYMNGQTHNITLGVKFGMGKSKRVF